MAGRKKITIQERFAEKFQRNGPDECWPWTAGLAGPKPTQYGNFRLPSGWCRAHRYAYQMAHGPIPKGKHVLHRCDNPICVNPRHLFLGTAKDNSDDCHAKGRGPVATQFKVRFSDELVAAIRSSYKPGEIGYLKLAKRFGVSPGHVGQLIKRSRRK